MFRISSNDHTIQLFFISVKNKVRNKINKNSNKKTQSPFSDILIMSSSIVYDEIYHLHIISNFINLRTKDFQGYFSFSAEAGFHLYFPDYAFIWSILSFWKWDQKNKT